VYAVLENRAISQPSSISAGFALAMLFQLHLAITKGGLVYTVLNTALMVLVLRAVMLFARRRGERQARTTMPAARRTIRPTAALGRGAR
jgi:hypothetical protein